LHSTSVALSRCTYAADYLLVRFCTGGVVVEVVCCTKLGGFRPGVCPRGFLSGGGLRCCWRFIYGGVTVFGLSMIYFYRASGQWRAILI